MKDYSAVFNHLEKIRAWYGEIGTVCEPGYDPHKVRLFGDWNPVSRELTEALEEHYELEWSDEWISCSLCGQYFRSQPDSYSWTMYGDITDGECNCGDCVKDDPTQTIEDAIDDHRTCLPSFINPIEHGFEDMNGRFESGLHEHMNDDPKTILAEYQAKYPDHEFVFGSFESSQFYVTYHIFGRKRDE